MKEPAQDRLPFLSYLSCAVASLSLARRVHALAQGGPAVPSAVGVVVEPFAPDHGILLADMTLQRSQVTQRMDR